jgi:outer membrane protein assembly factor BamB
MRRIFSGMVIVLSACTQLIAAASDENWPQWRGPRNTGVAADGDYPVKFSSNDGVAWKVQLPGPGSSTPAIWGDRIFVTCQINGKDAVVCYDMNGEEQWRREFGPGREGKKPRVGTGSNPSPVTDGENVVVYYKSGSVACLDTSGAVKWQLNLQDRYGEDTLWWDLGTSPVLVGDKAIIAVMHEGPSYLIALDLQNGEVIWKQEREYDNERESDQAYTTPQVVQQNGKDVIVTWGADHLTGHDAETGELLWQSGGFNPENKGMWRVIASAPIDDGLAIVPYGRGEFLAGVRVGGEGDVTTSNRVWEKRGRGLGSDVPTPVVDDGKAYLLSDSGQITSRNMRTGKEIWSFDLPRNRNKFYASPVLAGDKLYCTREDGTIFVGRVSDEGYEPLAENQMDEWVIATPVPIRGGLLIRGEEHLFWVKPVDGEHAGA